MRGPEHYREAERLLAGRTIPADAELGDPERHYPPTLAEIAAAHVHATLARVALEVEVTGVDQPGPLGIVPDWAHALNGGEPS